MRQKTSGQDQAMLNDENTPAGLLSFSDLKQKDRIQILLSEYSTLRAEIISRTANGFTLTTIGVTVLTWVIKEFTSKSPWYYWLGALTLVVVFGLGVFVNIRDITRAAQRVKALELEINSRAGEHLLIWESLSGVATRMGIIRSFFCNVKPLPRSQLPPLQASYLVENAERHPEDFKNDSDSSSKKTEARNL